MGIVLGNEQSRDRYDNKTNSRDSISELKGLALSRIPKFGEKTEHKKTDEESSRLSDNSHLYQNESATLEENNKNNLAEYPDMSTPKPIHKEVVTIYMSRIGNALMWWLIATLVISLALTAFT